MNKHLNDANFVCVCMCVLCIIATLVENINENCNKKHRFYDGMSYLMLKVHIVYFTKYGSLEMLSYSFLSFLNSSTYIYIE